MKYVRLIIAIFLWSIFFIACKKDSDVIDNTVEATAFQDKYGRTIILHGASLYTNDDPGGYNRYSVAQVKRLANDWGLNSVRMFWNWNSIEPDSAVFSPSKLDSIVKVIELFTNENVYVVLAVNGTATSSQHLVTGTWQAPSGNVENDPSLPGNTNPAAQEATRRFWNYNKYPYLQDEFIKASKYLAERLQSNPFVLGYDILNEPWGDGLLTTIFNSNLETELLPAFYTKYIDGLRKVEVDKYIFFEPSVLFNHKEISNFQTKLPLIKDSRVGAKRLSFAPHCYLLDPTKNTIKNNYDLYLKDLKNKYTSIQKFQQVPIYIGEWANINYNTFPDASNYLNKHMDTFDELKASWSYFSFIPSGPEDMYESPSFNCVSRVYPMATAGRLISFRFDAENYHFMMKFINNPSLNQPTEIFIPFRHFPNGYQLSVTGTNQFTESFQSESNIIKFESPDAGKEISIVIVPK